MTRKQAADFTGLSEKTISRAVRDGKLPAKYTEADLRAWQGTPEPQTAAIVPFVDHAPAIAQSDPIAGALAIEKARLKQQQMMVPLFEKTLLTIAEASALTGVSRSMLNEARKDGRLKSVKTGGAFRVLRSDAEKFARGLVG